MKKIFSVFSAASIVFSSTVAVMFAPQALAVTGCAYAAVVQPSTTSVSSSGSFDVNITVTKSGEFAACSVPARTSLLFKTPSNPGAVYGTQNLNFNGGSTAVAPGTVNMATLNPAMYATPTRLEIYAVVYAGQFSESEVEVAISQVVGITVSGGSGSTGTFGSQLQLNPAKGQYARGERIRFLYHLTDSADAANKIPTSMPNIYLTLVVNDQRIGEFTTSRANVLAGDQWFDNVEISSGNNFRDGPNNVKIELWGAGTSLLLSAAGGSVVATGIGTAGGGNGNSGNGGSGGGGNGNNGNGGSGGGGNGNTGGNGGGGPIGGGGPVEVINPPTSIGSIGELISIIIRWLLTIVGALSVLFIIIGGFKMVMSAGNESAVESGKKTVTWAVIGLVVSLMAFTLVAALQSVLNRN